MNVFLQELTTISTPLFLSYVVKYFNGDLNFGWAICFCILICFSLFLSMVSQHPQAFQNACIGLEIRTALNSLVYKKVCRGNSVVVLSAKNCNCNH